MKSFTLLSFLFIALVSFGIMPVEANAQTRAGSSELFSYSYETEKEGIEITALTEGDVEWLFIKVLDGLDNVVFINKFSIDGRSSSISIDLSGTPNGIYTILAKSKSINYNDSFKKY